MKIKKVFLKMKIMIEVQIGDLKMKASKCREKDIE